MLFHGNIFSTSDNTASTTEICSTLALYLEMRIKLQFRKINIAVS